MKTDPKATGQRGSKKSKINDSGQRSKAKPTEQKAATLNPVDKRLLATYQHATIGIVECSLEAQYVSVNAEFCRMLGYDTQELLARGIREVTYADDLAQDLEMYQKLVAGELPFYRLQKRFVRKDGGVIWAELTRSLVRDSDGKALYSIGVILDITEQKKVKDEIQNISRLPAENPNPIMRLTLDGQVLYANDASRELLNFWQQELGQTIPSELQRQLQEAFTSGVKKQIEFEEKSRIFSCTLVPLPEAGYINFYGNDITERKQAEDYLMESEKRFRILSNTVPSMVWSTTPDGTIQYVNEHWYNYTGLSAAETIANWEQLLHPDDYEQCMAAWKHALATVPNEYVYEVRYRRYDGEYRWFQSRAVPARDEEGNVTAWYGVTTDIHERHQRETEFQQLINNTSFMLTRCSRDLRYRFVSRAYAEMLQRTPEEIAGKSIVEIMGEAAFNTIRSYVERVLQGERVEYEAEVPYAGREAPFLHIVYTPDYDEHGEVLGWFASIMDVTERKAAEQERNQILQREQAERAQAERAQLEAEQANFKTEEELSKRKLAEAALGKWTDEPLPQQARPLWLQYGTAAVVTMLAILIRQLLDPVLGNAVQFTSLFGAIAFSVWYGGIGPALFAAIFGYFGVSWLIMDWQNILTPTLAHLTSLGIFMISSMTIMALGEAMRRAQRHAHESARVAVEQKRQAEFRLLEQQRVEEALRESERKFSLIYHNLPFAAALSTADNPVIVDVNKEFERAFGYSKTEALGKSVLELGINPNPQLPTDLFEQLEKHGSVRNLETELLNRSGEKRVFLSNNDLVHIDEQQYILTTLQDITERKQVEEQVRRAAEFDSFRIALMDALRPLSNPLQVQSAALRVVGEHLHVDRVLYAENDENNETVFIADNYVNGVSKLTGHIQLSDFETSSQILNSGAILNIADIQNAANLSEKDCASFAALDARSILGVPIHKDGRWTANLGALQGTARQWQDNEIAILQEAAERIWNAMERARTQEAMRMSEAKYRSIVETAAEGIWEIDQNARTVFVNARMANMLGYSVDEIIGRTPFDFLFPEDQLEGQQRLENARQGGSSRKEFRYRRKDGSALWMLPSTTPRLDEQGNFLGSFSMLSDITDRKQVERTLAHERELLQRLFDTMPVMVSMYDPETNSMQLNVELERISGWRTGEVTAASLVQALYPDPEYLKEVVTRMNAIAGKKEWAEVRLQTRDGRTVDSLWTNLSIMEGEKVIKGVGLGIDITERKQVENSLTKFAREQEALYQLTDQLQRAESLPQIYDAALEAILNSLQCDRASILLTDEADVMHFVAHRGLSDEYRQYTDGHSPWTPDTKDPQPVYYNDIDASDLDEELKTVIKAEGISALAFIPLVSGGKLIGKFMTYFNAPHPFTETELDLSLTVARQLTFGIERERAEEQLHDSEDRLRLAVAAGQIGIWDIDLVNRDRTWTKEGKAIYGLGPDEFLDLERQLELTHPDDRAYVDQAVKAFRDEGTTKQLNLEHRIVHPDRSIHWVEVRGEAVYREAEPLPIRLIGTIVDITERKQSLDEIQRLNAELQSQIDELNALLEILPTGVWIGNADCSVITGNRAAYQMMGFEPNINASVTSPTPQTPTHLRLFVNGAEVVPEDAPMQVVARTGQPMLNFEHDVLFADGTQKSVYASIVPLLDQNGNVRKVIGAYSDFTERKEAERRLILLANISEQLRTMEDPRDLMYAVSKAVGDHLHAKRCLFNEIDLEHDIEIVHRDYCRGVPSVAGIHKVTEYSSATTAEIASGKTIVNNDSKTDPRTAEEYESSYKSTGERAYIAVPMMREGRWVASLWISDDTPRTWSKEDVDLLENIAERTWVVIEKLRIDEALRASEELYRAIARSIPNGGVYVVDKDLRYQVAEGVVSDLFGLSRDKLEGHTMTELFSEEVLNRMKDRYTRTMAGEVVGYEVERNGHTYWSQHALLADASGREVIVILDITERKLAEEALRSSEERMRLAIEANRMVAWEWNPKADRVITSDNFAEVYGLPSLSTAAEGFGLIWPEDLPAHRAKVDRITRQGGEYESEFRITRPVDGRVLWMEERATAMADTIGRVTRLVGVVTDITERKKAEEELRRSEERERARAAQLEAIMEAVPAAIWIAHDTECKVVTGNRASYEVINIPTGINASLSAPEGVHPTNFEVLHNGKVLRPEELPVQRAARGTEVRNYEEQIRFTDGTSIYLFGSAITLRDERNNPTGALAAFVDITARKQAEQALKQLNLELEQRVLMRTAELSTTNEQLLEEIEERAMVEEALRESDATTRLILDTSPDAIVITNKQGQIMNVNAQIKGLFGYEANEVLGQPIEILIPQRFHERHMKHRADYSIHPHRRSMGAGLELFGQRRDGSEFPIDAMLTPIRNQNISDWETMITIRDSTERKRMEAEIRENQKRLQILSQRIVEVQEEERRAIARELHDRVGQSLAALSLNLTIINNQLVNQASGQVNERLSDSIHLTKEVIALVRDVMANLRPAVLDDYGLEVALKAHLDDLKSRYGINIQFDKSELPLTRLNPSIEMTLLRITQEAFLNIVRHAHADQVTLALNQVDGTVRLTIRDNGVGIQSFAEANRPGSHGLTIMRERAEAVGGHLRVSAATPRGTKIEVTVPFQPRDRKDTEK